MTGGVVGLVQIPVVRRPDSAQPLIIFIMQKESLNKLSGIKKEME